MTKQKIQARSAALQATWSDAKSAAAELRRIIDIDNDDAKIIQEEIDWEILSTLLVDHGWTKVEISPSPMYIVGKWVKDNIQGKYKVRGTTWLFESEKDATMFILRWS